jgi:hypothetical protein
MTKRSIINWIFIAGFILILFPVIPVSAQTNELVKKGVEKNDYSQSSNWLCRPGGQDACAVDQASTIIVADGTLTREDWKPILMHPLTVFTFTQQYPTIPPPTAT